MKYANFNLYPCQTSVHGNLIKVRRYGPLAGSEVHDLSRSKLPISIWKVPFAPVRAKTKNKKNTPREPSNVPDNHLPKTSRSNRRGSSAFPKRFGLLVYHRRTDERDHQSTTERMGIRIEPFSYVHKCVCCLICYTLHLHTY